MTRRLFSLVTRTICAVRGHRPLTPRLYVTVCCCCLRRIERLGDRWYVIER